jgi:uncharacterized lipoprotein YbaY
MLHRLSFIILGIALIYTIESVTVEKFITGKVTYAGEYTFEKDFKVHVELRDTSIMDKGGKLVASTVITDAKSFPISYKLSFNPSEIDEHHTYSLHVRIVGPHGKLWFTNDVRSNVDLKIETPTVDIAVIRVGEGSKKDMGPKECEPVHCPANRKMCPYGFQKNKDGCEICKCYDPCHPLGKAVKCAPRERCFVDKQPDGKFEARCALPAVHNKHMEHKVHEIHHTKVDCTLPKTIGPCRKDTPRFFYNPETKECESFSFGGCKGNKNNFLTKEECEKLCKV